LTRRAKRAARLLAALPPRGPGGAIIWDVALIEAMLRLREVEKLTFLALAKKMGISRSAIQRFRTLSGWHPAPIRLDRGVRPIANPTYSTVFQRRHRERQRVSI
jgi:hypothetical protein